jgi:hypothetical protein
VKPERPNDQLKDIHVESNSYFECRNLNISHLFCSLQGPHCKRRERIWPPVGKLVESSRDCGELEMDLPYPKKYNFCLQEIFTISDYRHYIARSSHFSRKSKN